MQLDASMTKKNLNEILEDFLVDKITDEDMNISKDEIYYSDIESYDDENDQNDIYFSDDEDVKTILSNESLNNCNDETVGTSVKQSTTDVKAEDYSVKTLHDDKIDCSICDKKFS